MCIHGQKAVSRKRAPNLSEEGEGGESEQEKTDSFTCVAGPPRSLARVRRNSSATRRWI